MSSEYGTKSNTELKDTARAHMKKAETAVPCTAVMDVNWKALIAAMNTQIDMLSAIQKSLTELATKEELTSYMERQIEILTEYAESCRELTEQFTEMIDQKSIRSSGMIDVLGNRLIPHLAGSQKNV